MFRQRALAAQRGMASHRWSRLLLPCEFSLNQVLDGSPSMEAHTKSNLYEGIECLKMVFMDSHRRNVLDENPNMVYDILWRSWGGLSLKEGQYQSQASFKHLCSA